MIAAYVLIAGVLLAMVIGAVVCMIMGSVQVLTSLLPLAPWLVMIGTFLLILTELLLFFGGKDDRRTAFRDLGYLIPTFLLSAGLWFVAQHYLW